MARWPEQPIVLARHCACTWRPAKDAIDDDPDTWFDRDATHCPIHTDADRFDPPEDS